MCCDSWHIGSLTPLARLIDLNVNYITMTSQWPRWRLKSPASRLFTQPFIQTHIKENNKAPRHWPLCEEFTGTGEFPAQRASYAENVSVWWRHHDLPGINPGWHGGKTWALAGGGTWTFGNIYDDVVIWILFPHYCTLWGLSTADRWTPLTEDQ